MGNTDKEPARRRGVTGVHSLQRFVVSVPSLDEAGRFYRAFGLDVRRSGQSLELRAYGNPHCWGVVHANGEPKRLQFLTFGIFPEDVDAFAARIAKHGAGREPHPLGGRDGLWLADADGVAVQLVVAPNVSGTSLRLYARSPSRRGRVRRRHVAGSSRCVPAGCRTCCASRRT